METIIRGTRLPDRPDRQDIGISGGRIARIAPRITETAAREFDAAGRVVIPGLVETHFHLDKALLAPGAPREAATVAGAIRATAAAKRAFTVEDIAARARRALELAIRHGTTVMRTHVEVDPIVGLKGMEAILPLQREYAWAIDLQICVFPQEGIHQTPGTEALMRSALTMGGQAVGGVPYNDLDARRHLDTVFDLAREFDRDVDLHLDFFDDADRLFVPVVARVTRERGWEGRVVAGHMSALGALAPADLAPVAAQIRDAGISVLVLPATDLYLMGRNDLKNPRRGLAPARRLHEAGVNVAVSTNNVQNPFTPFGDADLLRVANILATAAHFGTVDDLLLVLRMATDHGARALRRGDFGLVPGARADLVLLDCTEPAAAVAAIPERLIVWKDGVVSVTNRVETVFSKS
ncbi:MAG: amidohydrolase family protein [Candidatus Rokubacteria bacterium]|nr:amidohydrolase family protein [Candidatus Rokubacteria bacterium]